MDLAALIIAILAFLMASANLIIYLAKNVFSSHTVQMVPVDNFVPGGLKEELTPDSFEEFHVPSAMDIAVKAKARAKTD